MYISNSQNKDHIATSIGTKRSTYIYPSGISKNADVFEDFWDFLAWLEIKKASYPFNHRFILNSKLHATEVIRDIEKKKEHLEYVFLFLNNTERGYQTTHSMALELEERNLKTAGMEGFYNDFTSINDFRMSNLNR